MTAPLATPIPAPTPHAAYRRHVMACPQFARGRSCDECEDRWQAYQAPIVARHSFETDWSGWA